MQHKSRSYDVWFLRYKVQRTKFFVILGHFLTFDCPNNQKNQNFEKIKKKLGVIIILHFRTPNGNHMIYGFWDIKRDRIFCQFGLFFCPFIPLTIQKINILKKWKNLLEISSFYMSNINQNHMMYDSWDMKRADKIFSHFGQFFALLPLPP